MDLTRSVCACAAQLPPGEKRAFLGAFDGFYSCVRNAQVGSVSFIDMVSDLVIWVGASNEGHAQTREPVLCRQGVHDLIDVGVDLGGMCLDESACRNIIAGVQRTNALTAWEMQLFAQVIIDVWHAKKSGKKQFRKAIPKQCASLEGFLRVVKQRFGARHCHTVTATGRPLPRDTATPHCRGHVAQCHTALPRPVAPCV